MHEIALMGDILNIIQNDIQTRTISIVTKIELIVGDICNAMPDALEMAFDIYKTQEISFLDKDSKLVIIREEAKAICYICDTKYKPDQKLAVCPKCQIPSGQLISGETFKVHTYEGS